MCLAGIQPQQMVAQAAGELALEGNRTQRRVLLRGRRWSSIRAGVLRLSEEQLAAVRRQGGSAPFSAQRPSAGVRRRPPRRGPHADVAVAEVFHISTGSITPLPAPPPPFTAAPLSCGYLAEASDSLRVDIWVRQHGADNPIAVLLVTAQVDLPGHRRTDGLNLDLRIHQLCALTVNYQGLYILFWCVFRRRIRYDRHR